MNLFPKIQSLFRNLLRRERVESELDLEVRSYAELLEEENMSKGMSPEEARRAARIEMGGPEQVKEQVRGTRAGAWIETVWRDLRSGARMLRKNPGFATTAILTLALGIGANTAVFSVVRAVLLSSLPYRQPERLVNIWGQLTAEGIPKNSFSEPEFFDLADANHSFEPVAAYYSNSSANLGSDEAEPQRVTRGLATWALFPLLGVQPILGHTFSSGEDQPGHDHVAVISYGLWRSFFAGDPNVVGRTMWMNNRPYTVTGVLPEGFDFAGNNQVWIPLAPERNPNNRGNHSLNVIGRLKSGVTVAQASADMTRFAQQLAREYPAYYGKSSGWGVFVVPLREELVSQIRPALLILMAATGIVLLIACANIANLLLARGSAREKEMAVRASLGAGQGRLIRQLLTESLLLSLTGCAVGLAFGEAGMMAIRRLHAEILPRVGKVELDSTVLWFALAAAVFTGLLFGLAPAIHFCRPRLHEAMKQAGREGSGGRRGQRIRNLLVVSEIAFSLLLVVGAGLTIRSFYRLLRVDPGFRTDRILTLRMTLPSVTYPTGPAVPQFFHQLLSRIRTMPGVESAGAISQLPMGGIRSSGSVFVENSSEPVLQRTPLLPYAYIETDQIFATPGYFETMKTPLVSGRSFTDRDTATALRVVLVDTKFAASVWPARNPLQQRVCINFTGDHKAPQPQWATVVGVVGHVHNESLEVEGRGQAYFPQTQDPFGDSRGMFVAIRTAYDPATLANSVRAQVLSMDRSEPVYAVHTMDEVVAASVEQPRLSLDLLGLFAGLAFALAAIGVYGVIAFTVSQRKHELGIRMALGAQAGAIRRMMIGQGARLAAAGVAVGLAGAWYLARYMAPLLYGVETRDPVTFLVVPVLLIAVTLVASWIPAARATRINPIETLRHQ